MSRILIISDTHFMRKNILDDFISSLKDIEAIIHCGDIYMGYQPGDISQMYMCKGNNDRADLPRYAHFTIDQTTFTVTHGHLKRYAYQPSSLKELLTQYPSDVICFGHTHIPYFYQDDDIMIINPGSLSLPRNYPRIATYAIYDTTTHKVTFYDYKSNKEINLPK